MLVKMDHGRNPGVQVLKARGIFHCIGRQAHSGIGKTREEAMEAYACRKAMTEEEFYDTGCVMMG